MLGYLAFRLFPAEDPPRCHLVDCEAINDAEAILDSLILELHRRLSSIRVGVVVAWAAGSPHLHCLMHAGYRRRRHGIDLIVASRSAAVTAMAGSAEPWHFAMADSDQG